MFFYPGRCLETRQTVTFLCYDCVFSIVVHIANAIRRQCYTMHIANAIPGGNFRSAIQGFFSLLCYQRSINFNVKENLITCASKLAINMSSRKQRVRTSNEEAESNETHRIFKNLTIVLRFFSHSRVKRWKEPTYVIRIFCLNVGDCEKRLAFVHHGQYLLSRQSQS